MRMDIEISSEDMETLTSTYVRPDGVDWKLDVVDDSHTASVLLFFIFLYVFVRAVMQYRKE